LPETPALGPFEEPLLTPALVEALPLWPGPAAAPPPPLPGARSYAAAPARTAAASTCPCSPAALAERNARKCHGGRHSHRHEQTLALDHPMISFGSLPACGQNALFPGAFLAASRPIDSGDRYGYSLPMRSRMMMITTTSPNPPEG
jgi:hypothetical protein